MTKKGFWRKLESISREYRSHPERGTLALASVLREAYQEDLPLPCGVQHTGPDMLNQLYISSDPSSIYAERCRWMLCYTSPAAAAGDAGLPEQWEELPMRFIVENALMKPSIAGLLFNHHRPNHFFAVPKELLDPEKSLFNVLNDFMKDPPFGYNP